MSSKKVKYVQLHSSDFLTDEAVQSFTATQFGCYCLIIFNLYANNGEIQYDENSLNRLCRRPGRFQFIWEKIKVKFYIKDGKLRHKRVDEELANSHERMNILSERGKTAAQARWNNVKGLDSNSLGFYDGLVNFIPVRSASDRTCFRNLTKWLKGQIVLKKLNEAVYERVLILAKEASSARKPAAAFMALVKKELNYETKRDNRI